MDYKLVIYLACALLSNTAADGDDKCGQFAKGQQIFSVNVFKDLAKSQSGNLIISPLSARLVLALTGEGAKGETQSELSKGLQLLGSSADNHKAISDIVQQLNRSTEDLKLLSANKLYVAEGFQIEKTFQDIAVQVYQSGIQHVDFAKSAQAANTVNQWVEDRTNHRIKNLIGADQVDASTKLVLVNALYFSGKWLHPFEGRLTREQLFYTSKTDSRQVEMMNTNLRTNYAYNDKLKAKFLKLGFRDTTVTMTFILPDAVDGLPALEEKLGDYLATQDYKNVDVAVTLPKFSIETTVNFIPLLEKLGIKRLFNPSQADLTGISSKGGLFVSFVVQKAYINVTETGAEAAAATAVGVGLTAILEPYPSPYVFRADHPFLYLIKDEHSSIILFVGAYKKVV